MDTPIFADVAQRGTVGASAPRGRAAHEEGRAGATSVRDLLRDRAGGTRSDDAPSVGTAYVGQVPGLLSFRLPA